MSILVDLDEVPHVPVNADAVGDAARRVRERWAAVGERDPVHARAWGGLRFVYETAQTEVLLARSWEVCDIAAQAGFAGADVASALEGLAADLADAAAQASALAEEIAWFRRRVLNHRATADPTHGDPYWGYGQFGDNARLRSRALTLADAVETAIARCRRALEAVDPAPQGLRGFASRESPLLQRAAMGAAHAEFENQMAFGILGALEGQADADAALELLKDRPDWLEYLWEHPPHHRSVEAWWAGLEPAVAATLVTGASVVVGNLNGVPYRERIAANRLTLGREVDRLRAQPADQRDQERLAAYEKMLDGESYQYDRAGEPTTIRGSQLLVFDPAHHAIATYHGAIDPETGGIPDWVDHVAVSVPGTGSTLSGFADERAEALYVEANRRPGEATAVIQWCGGEMPGHAFAPVGIVEAMQDDYSRDLAPRLASFVDAMPTPEPADVTVLGHSYGGATVGLASTHGLHADRVLFVSSAGMGNGVSGVANYPFQPSTDYYSMMVRNDAVVGSIQHPGDSSLAIHGQTPLRTANMTRLETGQIDASDPSSQDLEDYQAPGSNHPAALQSHSSLYSEGSTAFNNMVGVITGGEVQAFMPDKTIPLGPGNLITTHGNDRDDLEPEMLEID